MIPLLALTLVVAGVFVLALGLAGMALRYRRRNSRKARERALLEDQWKPLLLRVIEGEDPSRLISEVPADKRLFFVDFAFRYATRLRGMEGARLRRVVAPFLAPLEARLRRAGPPEQRARAVRTIGLLGRKKHDADLVAALDDESPLVGMAAARSLALRPHPDFVALVLERRERFQQWSPRFFASLLASAGPAAASTLRRVLSDDASASWIRQAAADALAELNDLEAARVAAAVLEQSEGRDLQCACLRLVERTGGPREAEAVRALLASEDSVVRLCAISAIAVIGDRDDRSALRPALDEPDQWMVLTAARALRKLGDLRWLATLSQAGGTQARLAAQVLREEPL